MEKPQECCNNQSQKPPHCIVVPYPILGHINPMLQFAKRLHHRGLHITFLLTKHLAETMLSSSSFPATAARISIDTFSDGYDHGPPPGISVDQVAARFREVALLSLREAVERIQADSGRPAGCIVYDSVMTEALEVANDLGIAAAAFFTQSCAVDRIFQEVFEGRLRLRLPLSGGEEVVLIPGLPQLEPQELPSMVYRYGSYPSIFGFLVEQFRRLEKAKWLFVNTIYKLEEEVIDSMAKSWPIKAVGPAIPSMYLDKRLPDDRDYGLSLYPPETASCLDWLNLHQPNSVIYVSFGSLAELGPDQMAELAWGLKLSDSNFLWVVRSSELSKLPEGFIDSTSEKGLVVAWGPQLEILGHPAISCFITHCGWNSTLESLSAGVPMVAMPQWTDQPTNAKYVKDVWKTGVRVLAGENGVVGRDKIAECVREVMESVEIRKNAEKWKEYAREAMSDGGSSDRNIQDFVSALMYGG